MDSKIAFDLVVKDNEQVINLVEYYKFSPSFEINYDTPLNISLDQGIPDYENVHDYWSEQVSKFRSRKKYKKSNVGEKNASTDELTIYRLPGALVFSEKLFISNFAGEIPRATLLGIKSFRSERYFEHKSYDELVEVLHQKKRLKTNCVNFRFSPERVILLSSAIQRNYYHWMVECLPKMALFKPLLEKDPGLKVLINANLPRFAYDSLALMGIPKERIVTVKNVTAYPELTFASRISFSNQSISPLVNDFYQDLTNSLFARDVSTSHLPKRIYISRKNSSMRQVINEDELMVSLRKLGFEIIDNERFSLFEQAQIFHNAEFIIGAHGAGLANLVFCQPKTKVIELIHDEFKQGITSYASLAELFSLEYYLYVSQADAELSPKSGASCHFYADLNMIDSLVKKLL